MEQLQSTLTGWQLAETAPKDDVILACFTACPIPVTASWNKAEQQWVFAVSDVQTYQGRMIDTFFQTEYETAEALYAWMPLPEVA